MTSYQNHQFWLVCGQGGSRIQEDILGLLNDRHNRSLSSFLVPIQNSYAQCHQTALWVSFFLVIHATATRPFFRVTLKVDEIANNADLRVRLPNILVKSQTASMDKVNKKHLSRQYI